MEIHPVFFLWLRNSTKHNKVNLAHAWIMVMMRLEFWTIWKLLLTIQICKVSIQESRGYELETQPWLDRHQFFKNWANIKLANLSEKARSMVVSGAKQTLVSIPPPIKNIHTCRMYIPVIILSGILRVATWSN